MPRRYAADRHRESAPKEDIWPPVGADLVDALIALHHPTRRRLVEVLLIDGPASVGRLAARTGLAPGSVSHHLKPLHRAGFIEPAPELARDTRESWWQARVRRLSWDPDDYPEATAGRAVADLAERANFEYLQRSVVRWMASRSALPEPWRRLGCSTDLLVAATPEQYADLESRLNALLVEWEAECRQDAGLRPQAPRFPVRAVVRLFPSDSA